MTEEIIEQLPVEAKEEEFHPGIEEPPEKAYGAPQIRIFRAPKNTPRMTVGDTRSYIRVRPVQASPVTFPNKYIAILDIKNEEVAFVENLDELDEISRQVVREELSRRYLKAMISQVESIQMDFGVTYWTVMTDRGKREFVTRGHENTYWATDTRLLLTDVDGNRFEIQDYKQLDEHSINLIEQYV